MKNVLIAAAAFAIISGSALAQEPPKPPAPPEAGAPGTPPPPPPPRGGPRHAPDKSAHIRVEDKGFKVDVKCAEDQSTVECAEIVYKLLDRVGPAKK